jgi:hypothetical protein
MTKTPLTRRQLDAAGCSTPDCGHDHTLLFFHGRCHPQADTDAYYDKRDHCVHIICAACEKPISTIKVADD